MRILYATDGSAPAQEGRRLLESLFEPSVSEVEVFTVTPQPVNIPLADPHIELVHVEQIFDADHVVEEAAEHLSGRGFTVSGGVARGRPAKEILRRLDAGGHDIVALGASHTSWMGNLLLGSVGMHVLHHARSSVVLAHRAPTGSGKVLFGTDGSEESLFAIRTAMQVLDPSHCTITVAMAVPQPWISVAVYPPGPPFGGFTEYHEGEKRRIEHAWEIVERACFDITRDGFKAEGVVLSGRPGHELLKEARTMGADLVVVGARGLGTMRRGYLGSVSDQIVRHAPAAFVGRRPVSA